MLRCHGCRKWPAIMLTVGRQRRRVEHWHVRYMQYSRARLINNSPLQTHGTFPSAILLCTCCHLGRCTSLVHDGVPCGIPLRTWLRQAMCICLHLGVGPCGIDRRRLSRPSICTRRGHGADPGGIHPGRRHRWRTWRILARASGHAASCRSTLCHRSSTWCPCPAAASCSSRFVHQTLPDRRTGRRSTSSLPFQLRWMTKKTQKISPPALMTMMLMTTRR
mmetsp:Transcript_10296/g.28271  ORF Transcript_10296/g.28271 Transcript_10296/m.28271 type:complete len:220 (+) Transcript_10296:978-1637(+)